MHTVLSKFDICGGKNHLKMGWVWVNPFLLWVNKYAGWVGYFFFGWGQVIKFGSNFAKSKYVNVWILHVWSPN